VRSAGIGGAGVAILPGADAVWYNPALAAKLVDTRLGLSYIAAFADRSFLCFHFLGKLKEYRLGGLVTWYGSPDFREILDFNETGSVLRDRDLCVSVFCGRRLPADRYALGVALKWVHSEKMDLSADALLADFGASLNLRGKDLVLSAACLNFGFTSRYAGLTPVPPPTAARTGISWRYNKYFIAAADLTAEFFSSAGSAAFGIELFPAEALKPRLGYAFGGPAAGLSAGLGLKLKVGSGGLQFDYAVSFFPSRDVTHQVAVSCVLK
jgi:hypothetical protein